MALSAVDPILAYQGQRSSFEFTDKFIQTEKNERTGYYACPFIFLIKMVKDKNPRIHI